jgi:urease accessory protein
MKSEALIVAEPGRRPLLEYRGAIALRRTAFSTVHMVSAAVTPLGGDTIEITVVVKPGAALRLHSVAASIVLPGESSAESSALWDIDVHGDLVIDPEPTVVAADARHRSTMRMHIGTDARVRVRERIQIGRSGEREGFWTGGLRVDLGERPLLRHRLELGQGSVADDAIGTPMACISELNYPEPSSEAVGTTLALAGGGSLSTWQGARL